MPTRQEDRLELLLAREAFDRMLQRLNPWLFDQNGAAAARCPTLDLDCHLLEVSLGMISSSHCVLWAHAPHKPRA